MRGAESFPTMFCSCHYLEHLVGYNNLMLYVECSSGGTLLPALCHHHTTLSADSATLWTVWVYTIYHIRLEKSHTVVPSQTIEEAGTFEIPKEQPLKCNWFPPILLQHQPALQFVVDCALLSEVRACKYSSVCKWSATQHQLLNHTELTVHMLWSVCFPPWLTAQHY